MRVTAAVLGFISVLLCSCSTATVESRPPTTGKGLYACVLTQESLNKLFERIGYGDNFWQRNIRVWRDSRHDRLFITGSSRVFRNSTWHRTYAISADEKITEIELPEEDFHLLGPDDLPAVTFASGKLEIRGAGSVPQLPDEYIPIGDLSYRYYVRRFQVAPRNDHFAVYLNGSAEELFRDTGRALQVQSTADAIYIVARNAPDKYLSLRRYERNSRWQLAEAIKISEPGELRNGWYASFADLDLEHSLVLFTEEASFVPFYAPAPTHWFRSPKAWLYDFKNGRYLFGDELPKSGGEIFAVLMPETFAHASYMRWSKKVGEY